MAKVSIGQFINQVKVEGIQKVHWPTREETLRTAIMVIILTGLLSFFFLATDAAFSAIVKFLLKQLG